MLNELKRQRDIVALEAFSIADTQGLLKRVFPSMVAKIGDFVGQFKAENAPITLTSNQKSFLKFITKFNLMQIEDILVTVPEGMNAPYIEYLQVLERASQHAGQILEGLLNPFSVYLAMLINSPTQKYDTSNYANFLTTFQKDREVLMKDIAGCFGNTEKNETRLKDVIERNADWNTVFQILNVTTTKVNSVDRLVLNKKVKECVDLLNVIIQKTKQDQFRDISPEVVKSLAEGVYQTALELEFFTAVYFYVLGMTAALDTTMRSLEMKLQ